MSMHLPNTCRVLSAGFTVHRWAPVVLEDWSSTHRPEETPEPIGPGRFHFWLALPVQSQISSCVPGVVDQPVSSRHLPDWGLSREPLDCGTKTWAPVLLQSYRSTVVPLVVPPA